MARAQPPDSPDKAVLDRAALPSSARDLQPIRPTPPDSSRTRLASSGVDDSRETNRELRLDTLELDALEFDSTDEAPASADDAVTLPPPVGPAPAPPSALPVQAAPVLPSRAEFDLDQELEDTFDALQMASSRSPMSTGGLGLESGAQLSELRTLFAQIAAVHVQPIVDFMANPGAGPDAFRDARSATQMLIRSCRGMGSDALTDVFVGFLERLDAVDVPAGLDRVAAEKALGEQYQKLAVELPEAFAVESNQRACEAIVVRSLLCQVAGARAVTIDRIFQAGLGSLSALTKANVGDVVAATGLEAELAHQIVERVDVYRADRERASQHPLAEIQRFKHWLRELRVLHRAYEESTGTWTEAARADRRTLRRQRSDAYLEIVISLAHMQGLGLIDDLAALPFERKIARLDAHLRDHFR